MANKKTGSSGRLRVGYGKTIRERISKIENKQRQKQICPYCKKPAARRLAKGIWQCKHCKRKFTSKTYFIE